MVTLELQWKRLKQKKLHNINNLDQIEKIWSFFVSCFDKKCVSIHGQMHWNGYFKRGANL